MEVRNDRVYDKALSLFNKYTRILLVEVDHIGSKQIQQMRKKLRGEGELLHGRNVLEFIQFISK